MPRREPNADDVAPDEEAVASEGVDRRAADGVGHLQSAARELIQAARALLDVVEELVDDPATVGVVTDAVGSVVRQAARVGRQAAAGGMSPADPDGGARRPSGVERIRVG